MQPPDDDLPRYDPSQSYLWNYDHAPVMPPTIEVPELAGRFTFCGRAVPSPLGIAAGPLLNGRWILYYAALGFDVLTYKTTRSVPRACYPLPNLQAVETTVLSQPVRGLRASHRIQGSWAISFGMPSMAPDVWRADVARTRAQLSKDKLLVVSVVASAEPDWSLDDIAEDFARCARWAVDSGADAVETNFSCPNVATLDGQLYQQPDAAGIVAARVRAAIGGVPYIIKIGFVGRDEHAAPLIDALAPFADALSVTNCISATIEQSDGTPLFGGEFRGIGGAAIREASLAQVRRFTRLIQERRWNTRVIGVGGISQATHVHDYLDAGAESVQLATAVMLDPLVGCRIRGEI